MTDGEYYGRLALDKTAELERRLENVSDESRSSDVRYGVKSVAETLESSPIDNTIVRKIRWRVVAKTGAEIKISFKTPQKGAVRITVTLNGDEKLNAPITSGEAILHVGGILPVGINAAVVTATSDAAFTAELETTFYGYFENFGKESRLSYAGEGCVSLLSDGTFGVYDVATLSPAFRFYGVKTASAVKLDDGSFCLATVTDRGGAEIRFVTKSGEEIRKFTLGKGYVAFAARKNGGGAIVYAAKNARLKEISVTSGGVAEVPAQIRCIGLSYAEYGDVKLLGVRNPYGYEYVYEVE